jgi:hypothetical protein
MPTGWRPADVAGRFPVSGVDDVYAYQKFDTRPSFPLLVWCWAQLSVAFILMLYLFNQIGELSFSAILLYGIFLFASVYSFTTLMDKSPYAIITELIKSGFGLALLWWQGDWFGIGSLSLYLNYLIAAYFILSPVVVYYFVRTECREERPAAKEPATHRQVAS